MASTQTDTNSQSEVSCPRCGYVKHYNSKCPAINVKCNLCNTTGHYARYCSHKAQTRKPQYKAKRNQLVVDADRDNVSLLGELVLGRKLSHNVPEDPNVIQPKQLMGRKLRSTVTAHPNVLQHKLPNAVHYGAPFSHLITELKISPIQLQIGPYVHFNWRYLQFSE